jgi:hypothetical protein
MLPLAAAQHGSYSSTISLPSNTPHQLTCCEVITWRLKTDGTAARSVRPHVEAFPPNETACAK